MDTKPHEQLAQWRSDAGLSLKDAGARCGVSAVTFHDWERGKKRPEEPYREIIEAVAAVPREAWRSEDERGLVARVLSALDPIEDPTPSTPPEVAA